MLSIRDSTLLVITDNERCDNDSSVTAELSHMNIRIWDIPYAYGPIYAYGAEHKYCIVNKLQIYIISVYSTVTVIPTKPA